MLIQLLRNNPNLLSSYQEETCDVLLMQDAVYCANIIKNTFADTFKLYALDADWKARGLAQSNGVELLDYAQWVLLASRHKPVITLQ